MSPGGPLVTTTLVGGAVHAATGSVLLATGIAPGGSLPTLAFVTRGAPASGS